MSPQPLIIKRDCPKCRQAGSVSILKNSVQCAAPNCGWAHEFSCPLCDSALSDTAYSPNEKGGTYQCQTCNQRIDIRKIQYLLENALQVDHQIRCRYCQSPTIHHSQMNMSHRCYFFPQCSGQVDLFSSDRESLTFLDFETTGLDAGRDTIIEVGALKIDEDGYEHTFQTFVNPGFPLKPHITRITGITDAMIADAPAIDTVIQELAAFIGTSKLVAHNAEFDLQFLLAALKRAHHTIQSNHVICTLVWATNACESSKSLGALTKKYGIGHKNAHRALADAAATKELFFIFENKYKEHRPIKDLSFYSQLTERALKAHSKKKPPSEPAPALF